MPWPSGFSPLSAVGVGNVSNKTLLKQSLRTLLAVIHNLARLLEAVNVIGTKSEYRRMRSGITALNGVKDAGRIVHRAKGVDNGPELVLNKATPYTVGKAGADKEHLIQRVNLETSLLYR